MASDIKKYADQVKEKVPNMAPDERAKIAAEVRRELLESQEDRDADTLAVLLPLGAMLDVEPQVLKLAEHTKQVVEKERKKKDTRNGSAPGKAMNIIMDDDDFEDVILVDGVGKAAGKLKEGRAKAKAKAGSAKRKSVRSSSRKAGTTSSGADSLATKSKPADGSGAGAAAGAETATASADSEDSMRRAMMAAKSGDIEALKLLLQSGIDINSTDGNGLTLAYTAAFTGNKDTLQYLAGAKADLMQACLAGFTPTFVAAFRGHSDVLAILVGEGVDMNTADSRRWTPTFAAAQQGHPRAVQILAAAGADVNLTTTKGFSPLFTASFHGHDETVRVLAQLKADLNSTTADCGFTPVFAAVQEGFPTVVKTLLEAGADPDIPEHSKQWTPALLAARMGKAVMLQLLCEARADCNKADISGLTAVTEGLRNPECADVLRRFGLADADVKLPGPAEVRRQTRMSTLKSQVKSLWPFTRRSVQRSSRSQAVSDNEKQDHRESLMDNGASKSSS